MFGYVIANIDNLSQEEKDYYRACYCGLCKSLGSRHGTISRITLTYDMTFLVLFLSSLYNYDGETGSERCVIHPIKKHDYWQNEITSYAADMNVLLAYFNFIDDWKDDKNIVSLFEAKLFERAHERIAKQYQRKCGIIGKSLDDLSAIEKSGELNADIPANCFGELMGEIFVFREDEYADNLRSFGKALGKFIYIMDACLDLKADIKKERYNPLITSSSESFNEILNLLIADCVEKYKLLPIEKDKSIIENILYSGVWTRYEAEKTKKKKGSEKSKR